MKSILYSFLTVFLFFPTFESCAQKNIIFYYDYNFEKTNSKNAFYFSLESIDSVGNYKVEFYKELDNQLHAVKTFKTKKMNVLDGKYEIYQANNKLKESGLYVNGEKNGIWKYYHEYGNVEVEKTYQNGDKLDGPYIKFYENGDTSEYGNYQDGNRFGKWLAIHKNGNLKSEQFFLVDGIRTGNWKEFYEAGGLKSEGEYLNDSLNGIWKWYHPNGQPSSIEEYNNGALVQFQFYNDEGKEENYSDLPYIAPEFSGGKNDLLSFLAKNINYPPVAQENGIQGRVVLKLEVTLSGHIVDVEILKDIGGGCGEETVRVVKKMPKWSKSVNHNLPFNLSYILPVKFTLQ